MKRTALPPGSRASAYQLLDITPQMIGNGDMTPATAI
jgi:hypothetical protein